MTFPYKARAFEVEAARLAINATAAKARRRNDPNDPATIAWEAAIVRFRAALEKAYPPDFWPAYDALKSGKSAALEPMIAFLEADPWFFRSGYVKERLIRLIKQRPLTKGQIKRLHAVVLNCVDLRDRQEFRAYRRLALRIDNVSLRSALLERFGSQEPGIKRRAGWMLAALGVDLPEAGRQDGWSAPPA